MTNGNDSAFARPSSFNHTGLTKREHMSIQAMLGILSIQKIGYLGLLDMQCIAEDSVKMAVELIKALNETK